MFEWLEHIDRVIFLKLNGLHCALLDTIIPVLTNFPTWIPLFALVIYFLYKKYQTKTWLVLLAVALMIAFSDQSANILKHNIKRYRPTHNTEIGQQVHTVDNYRGGQFGFVSGHAANSFALAVFLMLIFRDRSWKMKSLFLLWALLVCYTRIYLGVHYPFDIIGGAILGSFWAFTFYKLYLLADKKIKAKV